MTTIAETFDVVIIGGGVAGGSLAAALARRAGDARVLLVEQTRASGAIDRGDMLWPPHQEMLERWGVLDEIWRRGAVPMRASEFYDNSGNLLLRHGFRFFRSRFDTVAVLEHPQIEEALLTVGARNPNLTIWRGARFEAIEQQDATGLTLRLSRDGQDVQVRAAWAVAADGRQSRLREAVGIESPMKPYPYDLLMTYIPRLPQWTDTSAQFQGPNGYLGVFIGNGDHTRLALPLPSGTAPDFLKRPPAERTAEIVRRAPLLQGVEVLWDRTHIYKLFEHHAPTYTKDRVILMGDAAHTFTPMMGMGMNLAMEDADALSQLLAYKRSLQILNPAMVKREYEERRRPRNQRILARSTQQGTMQVAGGRLVQALTAAMFKLYHRLPALGASAMRALYR